MTPAPRKPDPFQLVTGMTGVKLGDRIVQIGCAHGGRLAAVAARVGLSGRAVAVVPDAASASRAAKGAEAQGVFIEIMTAPATELPLDADAFDLAIVDDTSGFFATMAPQDRASTVREILRVLRSGGRVIVIGSTPPTGLRAIFSRSQTPVFDARPALETDGFTLTRVLGEREGLRFTEGVKPRT
jgi:ubiquinone/menaquinone biosynthesis C-methylase UbiE